MHSWGLALREGVFAETKEGKCKKLGVILSMQKRVSGASAFISSGAGPIILLTAGVMLSHLVARFLPQTILISFLACDISLDFLSRGTYRVIEVCQVLQNLVLIF